MSTKLIEWYANLESDRSEEVKLDFAVQLSTAIDDLKLTRQEYAKRVGVSGARITKALRGDSNLTIDTMDKLAAAAGRDVHVHLARKGSKVRFFEVISSAGNSFQTTNNKSPYISASKTYSSVTPETNEELIAL